MYTGREACLSSVYPLLFLSLSLCPREKKVFLSLCTTVHRYQAEGRVLTAATKKRRRGRRKEREKTLLLLLLPVLSPFLCPSEFFSTYHPTAVGFLRSPAQRRPGVRVDLLESETKNFLPVFHAIQTKVRVLARPRVVTKTDQEKSLERGKTELHDGAG